MFLAGILQSGAVAESISPELSEKAKYFIARLNSDNETEDIPPPPAERYKKPEVDTEALLRELGEEINPKYTSILNPNVTQR